MSQNIPKVSVISVLRNSEKSLEKMIQSLDSQTFNDWEHVVVDGLSSDRTLEILAHHPRENRKVISETDEGIYDAFNKGVLRANGKYICFLNGDDWYEPQFLQLAVSALEETGADWVFGDNTFHFENKKTRVIEGDPNYFQDPWKDFSRFHHTTVLAKKELFTRVGFFPRKIERGLFKGKTLFIANDYYWFLKCQESGAHGVKVSSIMGHMSWGGLSTTKHVRANLEAFLIASTMYGFRPRLLAIWIRRLVSAYFGEKRLGSFPRAKLLQFFRNSRIRAFTSVARKYVPHSIIHFCYRVLCSAESDNN
jgi:glycosyltransferase involved in cell wall biosynthesis